MGSPGICQSGRPGRGWPRISVTCARLAGAWMLALSTAAPTAHVPPAGSTLRLLSAGPHGALVELITPSYSAVIPPGPEGSLHRLTLPPGSGRAGPHRASFVLGVPPGVTASVRVVEADSVRIAGRDHLGANFPLASSAPARLSGLAWLRHWRLARVELSPFQYDSTLRQVIWHRRLLVRVDFEPPAQPPPDAPVPPDPLDNFLSRMFLNAASLPAGPAAPPRDALASPGPAAAIQTGLRLSVHADGLYRLTHADLLAAGGDLISGDPRNFHLSNQGREVALLITGEADGVFDPGDSLTFFGQAFEGSYLASQHPDASAHWLAFTAQTDDGSAAAWQPQASAPMFEKYTLENVYWLSLGSTPGLRMAAVDGAPAGALPAEPYFTDTLRAEQSRVWWTTHFTSEDTWLWEWIQDTARHSFTATIPGPAYSPPLSATVRVELVAFTDNAQAGPDHHALLFWNDAPAPFAETSWDGLSRHRVEASLPMTSLVDGNNQLHIVLSSTAAVANDQVLLDWFEVEYARALQAQADSLQFSSRAGAWQIEAGGFSSSEIEVYDVTQPLAPARVLNPLIAAGSTGAYSATIEAASPGGGRYLAVAEPAVLTPAMSAYFQPADLTDSGHGADYVFISPRDFVTATQRLAAYRAAQGLRTQVVSLDDVYNQFLYGIRHPQAIRNFLAHTFSAWTPPAPAYVLLVGDGHWNPLGYAPDKFGAAPVFMPPYLSWVDPWQGEVDSANLLATLVGDDPLPDLAIGRLPVNGLAELDAAIDKIIAYEASPPAPWQARLAFVADNVPDPAGDFVALTEALIAEKVPPSFQADRFYLNDYPDPADLSRMLTQTLNLTGTLLLNYTGHASWDRWAAEGVFEIDSLGSLDNAGQLPVLLSMTCLDGYWIFPHLPGLAESFVRAGGRGAVAAFSPTGLGVATGHDSLQRGFYDAVFRDGIWALGPASLAAKLSVYATGADEDLIHTFTIFGDPALRLLGPGRPALTPASASLMAAPGSDAVHLVRVENVSAEAAAFDVRAGSQAWGASAQPAVLTLGPGQTASVTVTVSVPGGAAPGASDTAYLTLTSQANAAISAGGIFTTVAAAPAAFLPLVVRLPPIPP